MEIELKTNAYGEQSKQSSFLVHNISPVSIIRLSEIQNTSQINKSEILTLTGAYFEGAGIQTLGFVFINLNFRQFNILHKFHVVPDNFGGNMPQSGILSQDFLQRFDCVIAGGGLEVNHENWKEKVKFVEKEYDGVIRMLTFKVA